MIYSFANAIRAALVSGVPCALPYSDIQLLQFIRTKHIKTLGWYEKTHVLVNPGSNADNLLACLSAEVLFDPSNDPESLFTAGGDLLTTNNLLTTFRRNKQAVAELKHVVDGAKVILAKPIHVSGNASLKAEFLGSNPLKRGLRRIGFEVENDNSWVLSINGTVMKRALAVTKLERVLEKYKIDWFSKNVIGVVTAIYFVSDGGLSFTGKVQARTKLVGRPNSTNANSTTIESVKPIQGWNWTVTGTGDILTESDPVDWIVAIEYLRVTPGRKFDDIWKFNDICTLPGDL